MGAGPEQTANGTPRSRATAPRHHHRTRRRWPTAAVLVGYAAVALVVTWSWWTPLGGRMTAINAPDAVLFSWLLTSTPHSVLNGEFPLFSDRLNAPVGINLMWNNGMVLPAVVFAPVTWLFGGLATVTVLTALGMAGSAATAYGALRALPRLRADGPTMRVLPAALGGAVFGFSPAMLAQALGHPNLTFLVLVPVLLLLAVRLMVVADEPRRTAVLLGVTAGAQVLIGEEVLFGSGVVVLLLLTVLAAGHPRTARARARTFAARAGLALGTFLLVAGIPLGFQLFGPLRQEGSPFLTAYYSADLAGFVVPTRLQAFASDSSRATSARFAGGLEEHTAFLGWPLVVLGLLVLVRYRRRALVRVPLLVALITAVLSMGPELTIVGVRHGVPLPWRAVAGLPGFEHVITTRFALFTAGLLGAGLAVALDDALGRGKAPRAIGLVAAAAALAPLVPAPLPGADVPPTPAFFTGAAVPECRGGSVLVLPFPRVDSTAPMLWQQAAGMSFAMPGGYFIGPAANGRAYVHGQASRSGQLFRDVLNDGVARPVSPQLQREFAADLARWRSCAVVLGPSRNTDALRSQVTGLLGRDPEPVDGVWLWRDLPPVAGGN